MTSKPIFITPLVTLVWEAEQEENDTKQSKINLYSGA